MLPTTATMVPVIREPADAHFFSPLKSHFEQSGIFPTRKNWLAPFLVFLFCLCGLPASQGQWAVNIDSFVQVMKPNFTLIQIVDSLNEIAFLSIRTNELLSEKYADSAYSMAQDIPYKNGIGDACVRKGLLARNRGEYHLAEEYFLKALAIREGLGEIGLIINIYHNLANLYRRQGKFVIALEYYRKGLNITNEAVGEAKYEDGKIKLLNGIATCYQHLGEYQKALEYNDEDIGLRKNREDRRGVAYAFMTSGNIYQKMNHFDLAESKYKESLFIFDSLKYQPGMAQSYLNLGSLYDRRGECREEELGNYQKALSLKEFLIEDELATLYRNIGFCYLKMEKPDSALFFYNQSREMYQSAENKWGLAEIEFSLGGFYADRNQHQKALEHFTESLNILKENQISDPSLESNLSSRLADSYTETGDYAAALQYRDRYSFLQDSLYTLSMNAANYKYSYEEERRENEEQLREIENLTNQTKIQHLKKMQLIYLFIGIIIILGSAAGIALLIYRQHLRKATMDREIDDLLRNQEITTTYARLEGQDEERRRVAQDLHDGLGSMLSTVKLYFSTIDAKMDLIRLESREQYSKANQLLDEACEEVRRVAHDMHSGILKKFGLKAQLEDLAETINNSKQIEVELVTHKLSGRLDTQLEVNVYRIIQELVGNALKHARASKLNVQLSRFENIIHILVEDNGVGFKENIALEKGGIGLTGIQSRVKALDGKIAIDSTLGRGTTVSIDIPYQPQEALLENH